MFPNFSESEPFPRTKTIPSKICNCCQKSYPLLREFFHVSAGNADGFCNKCKVCIAAYGAEYRKRNRDRMRAKTLARKLERTLEKVKSPTKKCARCRRIKPKDQFNRDSRLSDGKRSICRKCQSILNRKRSRG